MMDKEILAGFIEEAQGYLPEISTSLDSYTTDANQLEALEVAHRHMHTIKGAAAMVGLQSLSQVAAQVEDILEIVGAGSLQMDDALTSFFGFTLETIEHHLAEVLDNPELTVAGQAEIGTAYQHFQQLAERHNHHDILPEQIDLNDIAFDSWIEDADENIAAEVALNFDEDGVEADEVVVTDAVADHVDETVIAAIPEPMAEIVDEPVTEAIDETIDETIDENMVEDVVEEGEAESAEPVEPTEASGFNQETDQAIADPLDDIEVWPAEQATFDRIGFTLGEDVLAELMQIFALEAEDHVQAISTALHQLDHNAEDRDALQEVRRRVHTIKGSASTIGLAEIAQLAHRMEDVLDQLFEETLSISDGVMSLVYASADMLEDLLSGATTPKASAEALAELYHRYTELLRLNSDETINATTVEEDLEAEAALALTRSSTGTRPLKTAPFESETASVAAPFSVLPLLNDKHNQQVSELVRVPIDRLNELVNLVSQLVISNTSFEQRLQELSREVTELEPSITRLRNTSSLLERQYEARTLGKNTLVSRGMLPDINRTSASSMGSLVNFDDHGFDELEFDLYTEFHLMSRGLAETTSDVRTVGSELRNLIGEFDTVLGRQSRLVNELQQKLMKVRMVPLSALTARLRRAVRVVADQRGKQVDLIIEGEHITLDKTVLEEITDPLLHILRNAVDHGIETTIVRESLGKEPTGHIYLQAFYEGNQAIIRITDDGAGLDLEEIRAKAIQSGLVTEIEANQLTDQMLEEVIFLPGFSTADTVNEVSGRGMGMDVVRANINRLKGSVTLNSELNRGTSLTIRLPMTLAITQALLVKANNQTFAIPQESVTQIIRLTPAAFEKYGQETVYRSNDQIYPVVRLGKALNLRIVTDKEPERFPVLLLRSDGNSIALVVDELIEGRDIVVKSLGDHLHRVRGIAGATLMGDGTVVLILNPNELYLTKHERDLPRADQTKPLGLLAAQHPKPITVMVVDDSVSVRRVVSNLIREAGWQPLMARDGLEALEVIQQATNLPDLILLDIEMPRMDGYELTTTLRRQPNYQDIPIVMLTSRAGEKHRRKAYDAGVNEYLVKPYQEEELLQVVRSLTSAGETQPA